MKKILTIAVCFIAAVLIAVFVPTFAETYSGASFSAVSAQQESVLTQKVESVSAESREVSKIFSNGQLIGILTDQSYLDTFLNRVYKDEYAADFPDSSVSLGQDVYVVKEISNLVYDNIDAEICSYLKDNNLFSLQAASVEFSDENGVYAEIYVRDTSIYENALSTYLSYFIDSDSLSLLSQGQKTEELKTYGSRYTGISISQTVIVDEASYAPADSIMTTEEEVLHYLEYGTKTDLEYYTVEQYDTVAGVGAKNYGLSATQVMNINRDKIQSTDQVLSEGEQLCVTYFESPIDIVIEKESMKKEPIYPETVYEEDETLREGNTQVLQTGINGSKNTLYDEKWINGVLVSGTQISSVDTLQPQNEVVAVGTLQLSGYGTGSFRWPVDNPTITCLWGCYAGHRAIDIQNAYNHYGNIYAADNGVIEEAGYNGINGNYVVIDHQNGYETYYGHMNVPCFYEVGDTVEKGDIIGQLGMTGVATGPHTHFFIMYNDERKNPCDGFLDC